MGHSLTLRTLYFSSWSMVSRTFSALSVYSTSGHHPHPLGYLCAEFRFLRDFHESIAELAHGEKSRTPGLSNWWAAGHIWPTASSNLAHDYPPENVVHRPVFVLRCHFLSFACSQ